MLPVTALDLAGHPLTRNYLDAARSVSGGLAAYPPLRDFEPYHASELRGTGPGESRNPNLLAFEEGQARPYDRFQMGVAETLSPTMGGYGMGQMAAETALSAREGDWAGAAESGVPLMAIFAGPGARTASRAMLARAQEMAGKGVSRDAIWNETGWFQGGDGKWRFEIDDSSARTSRWRSRGPLRNVLKHRELYEAYPDVGSIPTRRNTGSSGLTSSADYQERGKGLFGRWRQREEIRTSPIINAIDPEGKVGRLLHEAQHAIQKREGFARGASQDEYSYRDGFDDRKHPRFDHAREAIAVFADEMMLRDGLDPRKPEIDYADTANVVAAINRKIAWERARAEYERKAHDALNDLAYRRSAGEVEARNVVRRHYMTAEQRRATPPWMTEDMPAERQLIQRWGELSPVPTPEVVGTMEILPPARVATSPQRGEKGRIASASRHPSAPATGRAVTEPSSQVRGAGEDDIHLVETVRKYGIPGAAVVLGMKQSDLEKAIGIRAGR